MNILIEKYGRQKTQEEVLKGFEPTNKHVAQELVDVIMTAESVPAIKRIVVGPEKEDITIVVDTENGTKNVPLVIINTFRAICKRSRLVITHKDVKNDVALMVYEH